MSYRAPGVYGVTKHKTNNPNVLLVENADFSPLILPSTSPTLATGPSPIPIPSKAKKVLVTGNAFAGHITNIYYWFKEQGPTNWTVSMSGLNNTGKPGSDFPYDPTISYTNFDIQVGRLGFQYLDGGGDIGTVTKPLIDIAVANGYEAIACYGYTSTQGGIEAYQYGIEKGMVFFGFYIGSNAFHFYQELNAPYKSISSYCTVSGGFPTSQRVERFFGPGLEFMDVSGCANPAQDQAASWSGASPFIKYAMVREAHPEFNSYDARQYMRQTCSFYDTGWRMDGGFGFPRIRPRDNPDCLSSTFDEVKITKLDPAPPLETYHSQSTDGKQVKFYWRNYYQTGWESTVVKLNDVIIYEGPGESLTYFDTFLEHGWPGSPNGSDGTFGPCFLSGCPPNTTVTDCHGDPYNCPDMIVSTGAFNLKNQNGFVWSSTVNGTATFQFYSRVNGELSRDEINTSITLTDLVVDDGMHALVTEAPVISIDHVDPYPDSVYGISWTIPGNEKYFELHQQDADTGDNLIITETMSNGIAADLPDPDLIPGMADMAFMVRAIGDYNTGPWSNTVVLTKEMMTNGYVAPTTTSTTTPH